MSELKIISLNKDSAYKSLCVAGVGWFLPPLFLNEHRRQKMGVKVYPTEAIYVGQSDKKEIPTEIFQGAKIWDPISAKIANNHKNWHIWA